MLPREVRDKIKYDARDPKSLGACGKAAVALQTREWVLAARKKGLTCSQIAVKSNGQLTPSRVENILAYYGKQ